MTTHHTISPADRTLLPRELIQRRPIQNYVAKFRFKIGQAVEFGSTTAFILERSRSAMAREIYTIFVNGAKRPKRKVRGEFLNAFHNTRKTSPDGSPVLSAGRPCCYCLKHMT